MRTETIGLALYGLATGLVGLLGWELYSARSMKGIAVAKTQPELLTTWKRLKETAKRERPGERSWDYSPRQQSWWQMIELANWTGAEPPEPVPIDPVTTDPVVVRAPQKPLAELVALKLVLSGGDDTRVQVQHLDPNVQMPAGKFENLPTMPGQPPMSPTGSALVQVLTPGDALWKPHHDIKLERVEAGGPSAVFSRVSYEDPSKRTEHKLQVDELAMDAQSFAGGEGLGATNGGTGASPATQQSQWRDPGKETRRIGDTWMLSVQDREMLNTGYEDVFRDSGLEDFVARIPDPRNPKRQMRVRGVSIRRASGQLKRFGIRSGDVLIRVNGMKVTSKASAIRVGKDQYRRGTRRFELTFLSRGRELVRVYHAPNKK